MKLSEMTAADVAGYLREAEDAPLLPAVLAAAVKFVLDYTGLTREQADEFDDLPMAALAVCADLYDRRTTAITGTVAAENPVVSQILGAHRMNLL